VHTLAFVTTGLHTPSVHLPLLDSPSPSHQAFTSIIVVCVGFALALFGAVVVAWA
jgi:hypothetical protein